MTELGSQDPVTIWLRSSIVYIRTGRPSDLGEDVRKRALSALFVTNGLPFSVPILQILPGYRCAQFTNPAVNLGLSPMY